MMIEKKKEGQIAEYVVVCNIGAQKRAENAKLGCFGAKLRSCLSSFLTFSIKTIS
jgi:hypothetical protein